MKVLIVDDSPAMRSLIRDLVAGTADEVVECADGFEALDAHAGDAPDWTVMDVRMPRMNGLEAARRLRANWPDCRIILISSHDLPGLDEVALAAGARHFLRKEDLGRLPSLLTSPTPEPGDSPRS